jgi:hypothetical protein
MKELLKPWQVMPAKIIKMALEHAEKGTDFDHQISFLLLDIGVEITLKTYLVNKNQNVDHLNFKDLIQKVREESEKDKKEVPLDEVSYFHTLRNKLYHHGDGVKPTDENLEKYSTLAQKLIKVLIDVDVTDIELQPESKYVVQGKKGLRTVDDISFELQSSLEYFQESCAILTEQLHPKYATRKLAVKLQSIWEAPGGVGLSQDIFDDARSMERLRLFNKLTGVHTEDQELVDFLIEDANHLYVWIVLQDYSDNFDDDWDMYKNIAARLKRLSDTWKQAIDDSRLDSQKIYQEYKKIRSWISFNQDKIDKRLYGIFPDIIRSGPAGMYSFHPF